MDGSLTGEKIDGQCDVFDVRRCFEQVDPISGQVLFGGRLGMAPIWCALWGLVFHIAGEYKPQKANSWWRALA